MRKFLVCYCWLNSFHYVIPSLENTLYLCERLESTWEVFSKPIAKAGRPSVSDVAIVVIYLE